MTPCICEWSRVGAEEDWLHLPNEFPKGLDLKWQLEPVLTEADLIDANDATAIVSYKMFKMGLLSLGPEFLEGREHTGKNNNIFYKLCHEGLLPILLAAVNAPPTGALSFER